MSELEMKNEAEIEVLTDELSDEALDREAGEGARSYGGSWWYCRAGNRS